MNLESQDDKILFLRDGEKEEYGWEIRKETTGTKSPTAAREGT